MNALTLVIALVLGVLSYLVAELVFNTPTSALIGFVIAALVVLNSHRRAGRGL